MPALGLLWRGASISYGLLCMGVCTVLAVVDGSVFRRSSAEERRQLALARARLWDLSQPAESEYEHAFFELESGKKLHYLRSACRSQRQGPNLVIFLHGFPDSSLLWRPLLRSPALLQSTNLVAVDLPGFGGSDGISTYHPDVSLEAMTEYVLGMRELFLGDADGRSSGERGAVIIVGHDWGALVASRLAADAPQLADRFIISNTVYPPLGIENIKARWASSNRLLATWTRRPLQSLSPLRGAFATLAPVIAQFKNSGYVFIFNLPRPLPSLFGSLGQYWFLRAAHALAAGRPHPLESREAAEAMASSLGPGAAEIESRLPGKTGCSYPPSVRGRVPDGGWSEKIRIYSEGLATQPWEKSLETVAALYNLESDGEGEAGIRRPSSSGAGLFEHGPQGSFKAPMTVVWGLEDSTLDARIALEGWMEYCVKGSQVVALEGVNHWVPVDEKGVAVLEAVVGWAVEGEREEMGVVVGRLGKGVKMVAEK